MCMHLSPGQAPQAPEWRHADLDQLKAFIRARVSDGSYCPVFTNGLADED